MATSLSTIRDPQTATLQLGTSFSSLATRTDVFARQIQRRLSPAHDSAQLVSDYGQLSRPGSPWATVAPISLVGQAVQISVTVGGTSYPLFSGLVVADRLQPAGTFSAPDGTTIPTGQVIHECRGLDHLLERLSPHQSITSAYGAIDQLFSFNGDSNPPERNRSAAQSTDISGTSHLYAWGDTACLWSSLAILQYVLRFATAQTDYTWQLAGATTALDTVTPQVDPRGKTLRQIINECVRPQDGFALRYDVSGTTVTLTVLTLTDTAILDIDGATAVPANTDTFSLTATIETDRDITAPSITPVAESSYSRIEVYSEPIRITATLGRASAAGNDGLVPGWTSEQQTAFDAATDEARDSEQHRDTWALYQLPDDWTGVDAWGTNVLPTYDPLTATIDWDTPDTLAPPALVFERTFPWSTTKPDDLRPATLFLQNPDGDWIQPEKGNAGQLQPIGLDLPDTGPAIRLKAASNVSIAGAAFAGETSVAQSYDPYSALRVTVSFYSHRLFSIKQTCTGTEGTRRIYVPGYHLWLSPGANTRASMTESADTGILRDDRAALKQLAAQLASWYGRTRNTLSYGAAVAPGAIRIGRIIDSVYSGGTWTPVSTPVTSETWTWDDRGNFAYALATDFADLNLVSLSRRKVENTSREINRRVRRIEERLASTPLRPTVGGSGGGGACAISISGLHPDSPVTGIRVYTGNLYAYGYGDGTSAYLTASDITIKIPGIGSNVTLPSYGLWSHLPPCMGIRTVQTWTGATQTHASDVVYEVYGLALFL